ncbi:MAG TPA: polymer-forming cytoskeletal protein [Rhodothermales bacterium]
MRRQSFSDAVETAPAELTIIARGALFEGKALRVAGDLRVDGEVQVEELTVGERLIISPSGTVSATRIRARDGVVAGEGRGRFEVESTLVLKETGRISGVIVASRLIVEEGGMCDGTFSIGGEKPLATGSIHEMPFGAARRPSGPETAGEQSAENPTAPAKRV